MRNAFIKTLIESARKNNNILLLSGDLGFNAFEEFIKTFPNRFFNVGVAEANMVSLASGLSFINYIPFTYSIATFMSLRPYEQIIRDVAQHNANVKIIGVGSGFSYSHAGPSHHAIEDIGIMRSIPNMTIFSPADPNETAWATKEAIKMKGPVYIRLGKAGEINVFSSTNSHKVGKGITVKKGHKVCIITSGIILTETLKSLSLLTKDNIFPTLVHMPTIKPFDINLIKNLSKNHSIFISVEEHRVINGLGSIIADTLAEIGANTKLIKLGVGDIFLTESGSQDFLRKKLGIDAVSISKVIKLAFKK